MKNFGKIKWALAYLLIIVATLFIGYYSNRTWIRFHSPPVNSCKCDLTKCCPENVALQKVMEETRKAIAIQGVNNLVESAADIAAEITE